MSMFGLLRIWVAALVIRRMHCWILGYMHVQWPSSRVFKVQVLRHHQYYCHYSPTYGGSPRFVITVTTTCVLYHHLIPHVYFMH